MADFELNEFNKGVIDEAATDRTIPVIVLSPRD
jgi:hypothetical protein